MSSKNNTDRLLPSIVDTSIKVAAIVLLVVWSAIILAPFIIPMIWGAILAVACSPLCTLISDKLGGRRKLAAIIVSSLLILAIFIPCWLLADSLVAGARTLKESIEAGNFRIPPPSEKVRSWPVIGEAFFKFWDEAALNIGKVLNSFAPQLRTALVSLLGAVTSLGMAVLQFLFSSILAGIFLAYSDKMESTAKAATRRIDQTIGHQFLLDAVTTIRNVARGILGVAFIQAMLAGIGLAAVGIPGAGLWAMLCLILGIVQVGCGVVMVPAVIYIFSTKSLMVSIPFLLWALLVTVSDNILKPIMLGKGAPVPMLVVFLGSIGGLLNHGLIGLFVGAIVLSLGYKLVTMWVYSRPRQS